MGLMGGSKCTMGLVGGSKCTMEGLSVPGNWTSLTWIAEVLLCTVDPHVSDALIIH
jgi:hypothetical protein